MIAIYYDVENLGSCHILFVIEQLYKELGVDENFLQYAYCD